MPTSGGEAYFLRRPRPLSATSAKRRHETSPYVSNAQIAVIGRRSTERSNSSKDALRIGSGASFGSLNI
jgi:hypothetical protein